MAIGRLKSVVALVATACLLFASHAALAQKGQGGGTASRASRVPGTAGAPDGVPANITDAVNMPRLAGLPGDCQDTAGCGIQSVNDCTWQAVADAQSMGMCGMLADPVERHACGLGLLLDGDVSDGVLLAMGGLGGVQVDLVSDVAGNSPGVEGDSDEPRLVGDPNGFNIGTSVLVFQPDSDPTDNIDDSFIYVGIDISDLIDVDGVAPGPFDSDDDGSACTVDPLIIEDEEQNVFDHFSEAYAAELQACTSAELFGAGGEVILSQRNPLSIGSDNDGRMRIRIDEAFGEPLEASVLPVFLQAAAFPTADGATNPTNACIDQEVSICGQDNDVEMILAQVETNGAFGPHAMAMPDSEEARQNRIALSQLLSRLSSDSTGDGGDEEFANVALRTSIPGIEVTKGVRCAGDQGPFTAEVDSFGGEEVEYQIVIANQGNEDLIVEVQDLLQAQPMGGATCGTVCGSLSATLTSPSRGLENEPINPGNATTYGLNPEFFIDNCGSALGFLPAAESGMPINLGRLMGATVQRAGGSCQFVDGDQLTVRFRVLADLPQGDMCELEGRQCVNVVSVEGTLPAGQDVVARDQAGVIDTPAELRGGADDNDGTVDVLCRHLELAKELREWPDGAFMSQLAVPPILEGETLDVQYRIQVSNNGDVTELVDVSDAVLCADIAASSGVSVVAGACPLCEGGGSVQLQVTAGGANSTLCRVQFVSQQALRGFLEVDNGRMDCSADDVVGLCYRNCVDASATGMGPDGVCGDPGAIPLDDEAVLCTSSICGDGIIDPDNDETCDPPGEPAGDNGNLCRDDCTVCGDGVVDMGEECDDGNGVNDDECRNDCTVPICGDGILDDDETCDPPGEPGGNNGNLCRENCTVCGDGILDMGEECDDGNGVNDDDCRNDCTVPVCGDGIVDPGEECDDGNDINDDECRNDCTIVRCGDKIVDVNNNETCDPPGEPGGNNGNLCRENCTVCGDGILDMGEECDDGNGVNDDACRNDCTAPVCGDGIVDPGEECDDGNDINDDECRNDCTLVRCGDKIVDTNNGETCDPPGELGGNNGNICRDNCTVCGDGVVDPGEDCDDGNGVDDDACPNDCIICIPEDVELFFEDFEGYTEFPDLIPDGDPVNAGLPLIEEGAKEFWYGGRFEQADDTGSIDSDLAVQKFGGGTNNSHVGRSRDDAGLLFKLDTRGFDTASLTFDYRTFLADDNDELVAGYFAGEIDFGGSRYRDFDADGPQWDQWTQLLRTGADTSWKSFSGALPTGQECVWVAIWIDGGKNDYAKIDNIRVQAETICPGDPQCGDGVVDPGEECDDGNDVNEDGCRDDCTLPFCGDGIVDPGEDCDDGNDINDDECRNDCTICIPEEEELFFEDFEGYTSFPHEVPDGDPVNKGLPLIEEGAKEFWYGGRFEQADDSGSIDSDLAVQKFGGGTNSSHVGRSGDDAGLLFKIDTRGYTSVTLSFDYRTFQADDGDEFVAGYFVGEIDFGGSRYRDFNADGPQWDQWTQLLRTPRDNSWKSFSGSLPVGQECVWVALWIDGGKYDYAKVDDIRVVGEVECPGEEPECGNGVVEPGEECDDGNNNNDDDCRNDCTFNNTCECAPCEEVCPEPGVTRYRVQNHPDGGKAAPYYCLRLDELYDVSSGHDVFTFDCEHPESEVWLDRTDDEIHIYGVVYGGLDTGDSYGDPDWRGLWAVDFTYDTGVTTAPGDDDTIVDGPNLANSGTIQKLFGDVDPPLALFDYRGSFGYSFRFGDTDNDEGHRGFEGTSGWGWVVVNDRPYEAASDWLFTVELSNECYEVCDDTMGDVTPPVIECPDDAVLQCVGGSPDPSETGYATATDECDPSPDITFSDEVEGQSPYLGAIESLGPIHFWRLGEGEGSDGAHDINGELTGVYHDVQLGSSGAIPQDENTAARFDSSHVEIPHVSGLEMERGTIAFCFRADDLNTAGLLSKDSTGYDTGGHLTIRINNQRIVVRHQGTSSSHYLESGTISANQWYFVTYTFGPNGLKLYVNGNLADTNGFNGSLMGNQQPLVLGANAWNSDDFADSPLNQHFDGKIDEVLIFDYEMGGDDVQYLYTATTESDDDDGGDDNGGNGIVKIRRTWTATDDCGNKSSCVQKIELTSCDDGCSPGYWKTHWWDWPNAYEPGDDFDSVFGVNAFSPNRTLIQALWYGGGDVEALGRHAVAALLNASDDRVDYPLTVAEVIDRVQMALSPGGDVEGTKNELDALNNLGCPLDNSGGDDEGEDDEDDD